MNKKNKEQLMEFIFTYGWIGLIIIAGVLAFVDYKLRD